MMEITSSVRNIVLHKGIAFALCAFLTVGLSGCAGTSHTEEAEYKNSATADPLEPLNRGIFAFNDVLDRALIEPVAEVYMKLFPPFIRDAIQHFMQNLRSPLVVANNVLQGDFGGAGVAVARFAINTTAGIGGLVDVASAQGLAYAPEDFGQTLAVWGLGDGFYLVLPLIGPSTLRDTAGMAVDVYADPVRIIAENAEEEWIYYTRVGIEGLDTRARLMKGIKDLRNNSLDYYAAVRSAYAQKRSSLIHDEAATGALAIPDYDEENLKNGHEIRFFRRHSRHLSLLLRPGGNKGGQPVRGELRRKDGKDSAHLADGNGYRPR
jgi:phospholipid-binding lipoprotein MlaA